MPVRPGRWRYHTTTFHGTDAAMTSSHTPAPRCQWFSALAAALDPHSAPRLAALLLGLILSRGRRALSCWIRAAGLGAQYRRCYATAAAVGRRTERLATRVLLTRLKPLVAGAPQAVLALDDTPTKRYAPKVQGAGTHHNPAPGPAGSPFVYGHVWVVLARVVTHPRQRDRRPPPAGPAVHPPHEPRGHRGRDQVGAGGGAGALGPRVALVVGQGGVGGGRRGVRLGPGAQGPAGAGGDGRQPTPQGRGLVGRGRGRPRKYGAHRLSLARRAGPKGGWTRGTFTLYGAAVEKRYKTFVATWRPAGGAIRVVLVDGPPGPVAFFCTDPTAAVANILGRVADRFSLETCLRDLKQVVGAGRQQVRGVASNVGCFHLCAWSFTMTEVWAWD